MGVSLNSTAGAGLIPGARKEMADKVKIKIVKEALAGGVTFQPGDEPVEMARGAAEALIAQGAAVDADAPAPKKRAKKAARKSSK